jgi:hypothetical protein
VATAAATAIGAPTADLVNGDHAAHRSLAIRVARRTDALHVSTSGSAFEQLMDVNGNAYGVGEALGKPFRAFGSVMVADVQQVQPGIAIHNAKPERAKRRYGDGAGLSSLERSSRASAMRMGRRSSLLRSKGALPEQIELDETKTKPE